jgi:PIN domain nuclease of toxin-antitoxin system
VGAIYLDTHAVVWLYAGETRRFPRPAKSRLARAELLISPIVSLEIQLLFEIGRVTVSGAEMVADLGSRLGLRVCDEAFTAVAGSALGHSWTRDPFDRLIVAQAELRRAPLLTKDTTIRSHYPRAIWD